MGCGLAYISGWITGAGSEPMPYWFGPRPNPVRPPLPAQERLLVQPFYPPQQRLYPQYVYANDARERRMSLLRQQQGVNAVRTFSTF